MATLEYHLHPKTFLCSAPRHWVFLNVKRDQYLCLNTEDFSLLKPWLNGQNETIGGHDSPRSIPGDAAELLQQLVEKGILVAGVAPARPVVPTQWIAATRTLEPLPSLRIGFLLSHATAFLYASMYADYALRRRRLEVIAEEVSQRAAYRQGRGGVFPWAKTSRLVAAFNALRLFYPRKYLCLFDSLSLLRFLAFHTVAPTWVFGVVADPFEAHCWLQAENVVLNDTVETVSRFTPIMCL